MPATDGVRIAPIARGIAISAAVAWNAIEYRAISLSFEKCAEEEELRALVDDETERDGESHGQREPEDFSSQRAERLPSLTE